MLLKMLLFLSLLLSSFCTNTSELVAAAQQEYPDLNLKKKKGKIIIPFITCIPQHGPFASIGKQMLQGANLYLQQSSYKNFSIKHKGNLNISNIDNNILKKINRLKAKSPLLVGAYETQSLLTLLPFIKEKKLIALFPTNGTSLVRKNLLENIIYFRPPHFHELKALINYAVDKKIKNKIAVFYEASTWGDDVLHNLEKLLAEKKISLVAKASYPEGTVYVKNAVEEIAKHNPNAIFCIANPKAAYNFIRKGINQGLHKVQFLGLSDLHVIQSLLHESRGIDIAVSSILPNPTTSKTSLAKSYRKASGQYLKGIPFSPSYFEGYVYLAIVMKCLQKIHGRITVKKILRAIKDFKNENVNDIFLRYRKESNSLSELVWVNPGIGKKWLHPTYRHEIHHKNKEH